MLNVNSAVAPFACMYLPYISVRTALMC